MKNYILNYAWIFLLIAMIAAIFGFGGIAAASDGIARTLFYVFVSIFMISLLVGRHRV